MMKIEVTEDEVNAFMGNVTDDPIMKYFKFGHLTHQKLKEASFPFAAIALQVYTKLPRCPERTVALRKLLEAKDAAVRAALE